MTDTTAQESLSPSIGQILKAARRERKLTIEQISSSLCISKRWLSTLEEDEENLVCDVYSIGFIKQYAQYLELNAEEILEKFKNQTVYPPTSSEHIFPAPLPGRGMPSFRILALSLFVLAVIIIGWKWVERYTSLPVAEIALHKDQETTPIEEHS